MDERDFLIERSILKIGNYLAHARDGVLKENDVTFFQAETLLFFDAHEGAKILDLKDHLKISHQAARNLVERIRQKDLIRTREAASDARAKNVFLTEKGKDVCRRLKSRGGSVGEKLFSDFTDAEKKELLAHLDRIIRRLPGEEEPTCLA